MKLTFTYEVEIDFGNKPFDEVVNDFNPHPISAIVSADSVELTEVYDSEDNEFVTEDFKKAAFTWSKRKNNIKND